MNPLSFNFMDTELFSIRCMDFVYTDKKGHVFSLVGMLNIWVKLDL